MDTTFRDDIATLKDLDVLQVFLSTLFPTLSKYSAFRKDELLVISNAISEKFGEDGLATLRCHTQHLSNMGE